MRVLIGVDGSECAFEAVTQAGALLSAAADQAALYYTPPDIRARYDAQHDPHLVERARQALANAVFEEGRARFPEPLRAGVETLLGEKHPRLGLLTAAAAWKADMIVVGARGGGPIRDMLLGSVANSVAQSAEVPVLVVRSRRGNAPFSVLLATDESPASQAAGEFLKKLSWPSGAVGRVIAVLESLTAGAIPKWLADRARDADDEAMAQAWAKAHAKDIEDQRQRLVEYRQKLPAPFLAADPIVAEGHAAEEILKAANKVGVDLVVVGAHGAGFFERWLIGSTSSKVLEHAPCSVLVVHLKS